jgi:glycosyltransferase involved in cell wall biosynthesis
LRLAVIVPVLNEEACIGRQLQSLSAIDGLHEVIVVDGGSTDRTVDMVKTAPACAAGA